MSYHSNSSPSYQNQDIQIDERIEDLLGRMTLKEKARQLDQYSGDMFVDKTHPMMETVMANDAKINYNAVKEYIGDEGIGCIHDLYGSAEVINEIQKYAIEHTRLGIPILFSEEALHGLVRPGCTVFPHAISQASTWDTNIVEKIGRAIAAETRSFGIHETFGPVLDLAREPRWGRTEETYGEDTYLASRMGVAMVKGLQGEDLRDNESIIAEPKHFAVHGIPEGGLNTSACSIGNREMFTYYLPVFEAAIREGGAVNVMCSYNSIDGIPCCADRHLLTEILRNRWHMQGFVRSDLGAVRRLYNEHCTASNEQEAIRQALIAGTDMQYYNFPHEFYQNSIIEMVENGAIDMRTIDTSVARVLRVKFMLGLFDRPYVKPDLSKEIVRSKKHTELSLQAAREAISLLKNDKDILPLSKDIHKIAVIGPSAAVARLGDYVPYIEGFEPITILNGIIKAVSPETEIMYARGTGITDDEINPVPTENLRDHIGNTGLYAEYFNNLNLSGNPVFTRTDPLISFNWAFTVPDSRITAPYFSVRWTGTIFTNRRLSGYIGIDSQDSMRLWLGGKLLVDTWNEMKTPKVVPIVLEADTEYPVRIEYRKDINGRKVIFGWNHGREDIEKAVQIATGADVAIIAVGDSERTCGESVDRSSLDLPGSQYELIKAVAETGTPVILILQNGRPLTIKRELMYADAILEAWYPGDQGGTAIAEVLFGDYNPAGRLPISFPKDIGQIPVYYNRRRGGAKRYIEQDNQPLFAFGFGLSYTTFAYEDLQICCLNSNEQTSIKIAFNVINVGRISGDEVVQLYICDTVSSIVRPAKELKRFSRINLDPGEKKRIEYELTLSDLSYINSENEWFTEPGSFHVMIGPSSDNIALSAEFTI